MVKQYQFDLAECRCAEDIESVVGRVQPLSYCGSDRLCEFPPLAEHRYQRKWHCSFNTNVISNPMIYQTSKKTNRSSSRYCIQQHLAEHADFLCRSWMKWGLGRTSLRSAISTLLQCNRSWYTNLLDSSIISSFIRYCSSKCTVASGCAFERRRNKDSSRPPLWASWLRTCRNRPSVLLWYSTPRSLTSGGSCKWSPTRTNFSARRNGPKHAGRVICEASSTIQ